MIGLGLSIPNLATRPWGVPIDITQGGVVYRRLRNALTGAWINNALSGAPLYVRIF